MKKRILLAGLLSVISSFSTFAADINTDAILVQSVKADFANESHNSNLYYYTFKSEKKLPGECGEVGRKYAQSGDPNINKILQMAYVLDAKVTVGIDQTKACVITTAIIDDSY